MICSYLRPCLDNYSCKRGFLTSLENNPCIIIEYLVEDLFLPWLHSWRHTCVCQHHVIPQTSSCIKDTNLLVYSFLSASFLSLHFYMQKDMLNRRQDLALNQSLEFDSSILKKAVESLEFLETYIDALVVQKLIFLHVLLWRSFFWSETW